jgi:hypothetical protein
MTESRDDRGHPARGHLVVTPNALVFALTDEFREEAARCLERSGEIRISFTEVSVTNLTDIRELSGDVVAID